MTDRRIASPIASTASIDRTLSHGRAMTLLSGVGLVGLVTAVALRQPAAIAVPPGLVAAVAYCTARRHLRRQASVVASANSGQPVSDRSYAVAYPILAFGVLVGLFAAFVVVHEASRTIDDSAIHAAYWAAWGTTWLLPATVQTWQASPPNAARPRSRDGRRRDGRQRGAVAGSVDPPASTGS